MNAIDRLSQSSTALARQARRTFEATSSHLPQWLEAGAVLSVAKTGTKVATTLVRRNPGVAIALGVVGVGVLAYRFYRKRAAAQTDAPRAAISGKISRGEAKADAGDTTEASARRAPAKRARKSAKVSSRTKPRPE